MLPHPFFHRSVTGFFYQSSIPAASKLELLVIMWFPIRILVSACKGLRPPLVICLLDPAPPIYKQSSFGVVLSMIR